MLAENVGRYLAYMEEAAGYLTDIIVFPEYGVTGTKLSVEDRAIARQFMVVGDVGRNYCNSITVNINDDILQRIACGAVQHNMYVVVNIGEMVNCSHQVSQLAKLTKTPQIYFRSSVIMTAIIYTTQTSCSTEVER